MGMSDRIEAFINQLLSEEDGWIELRRNELASIFNCVPSQINYVLSTRFGEENGYITESKRGGGGYLRIRRINDGSGLQSYLRLIGEEVDAGSAQSLISTLLSVGFISSGEARIIESAVSDRSIPINQPYKNRVRAAILKNTLSKTTHSD